MQKLRGCVALVACIAVTILTGCSSQSSLDQMKEYEQSHPCTGKLAADRTCTLMSRIEPDASKSLAKASGLAHVYQARIGPQTYGWVGFAPLGSRCIVGFNLAGISDQSGRINVAIFPRYGTERQPSAFNGGLRMDAQQIKAIVSQLKSPCTGGNGKGGALDASQFPPVLPMPAQSV